MILAYPAAGAGPHGDVEWAVLMTPFRWPGPRRDRPSLEGHRLNATCSPAPW